VIETMLIAINANDRRYFNHQFNAIPVAAAKGVGLIAMKVFADGAMYTKEPHWTRGPQEVVQVAGTTDLPSRPLVEYALSTPGFATAIIGIGRVDQDGRQCQLEQNLSAAQLRTGSFSRRDRDEIERLALRAREGKTNYFQLQQEPLGPPRELSLSVEQRGGKPAVKLTWQTAYAGAEPIDHYEIKRNGRVIGKVPHRPQTSRKPFQFEDTKTKGEQHDYEVTAIDRAGNRAPAST
jgi:hypothetical protein